MAEVGTVHDTARELYAALIGLELRAKTRRQRNSLPYSRRRAASAAGISEQRISDWVPKDPEKAKVPHDAHDDVMALISVWSDWAGDARVDQRHWSNLIESAQPHRERTITSADATGPGIPIAEAVDPFAFEVHHAIEVETSGAGQALPPLTRYIRREHDAQLARTVASAIEGRSAMATLVGGSSCGKTRACWEAAHAVPDGWRLWHPLAPGHAEALVADIDRVGPRTVIWLNEAQHYLLSRTHVLGEQAAAKLRDLLRDPSRAPVLVLATLWPDYWRQLTDNAEPGRADDRPHARMLLAGTEIHVPERFDGAADHIARRMAHTDPRLAAALEGAESGMVIQYLAAGPALLDRYKTAPPGARALIEAAMDARVLGHGLEIPRPFLEHAAPGYLSDIEWDLLDDDWLKPAWDYCSGSVRGARGPLTRVRPRGRSDGDQETLYRLADFLEQYGKQSRRPTPIVPASLWEACAQYAHPSACSYLAHLAPHYGLYRTAMELTLRVPHESEHRRAAAISTFLAGIGHLDGMTAWNDAAVDAGETGASIHIARAYRIAGRTDEALLWYRRAVDAAELFAANECREMLVSLGRDEEARTWLEDVDSLSRVVRRIPRADADRDRKLKAAVTALEERADVGDPSAYSELARLLLFEEGYEDEQRFWAMQAAMTRRSTYMPSSHNFHELYSVQCDGPPSSHVVEFLTEHALRGDKSALQPLVNVIGHCAHDHPAALQALVRLATAGDSEAWWAVANYLKYSKHTDAALAWFRHLPEDLDDPYPIEEFADLLWREGHRQEALEQYRYIVDEYPGYETEFANEAARRFEAVGRTYEAIEWYLKSSGSGSDHTQSYNRALKIVTSQSFRAELREHYGPLVKAGDAVALWVFAQIALHAENAEAILRWCPAAIEAGRDDILEPYIMWLTETGRIEHALDACVEAARLGEYEALPLAVRTLRSAGRSVDADRLERYGWTPDYEIAEPWEPVLPPSTAAPATPTAPE